MNLKIDRDVFLDIMKMQSESLEVGDKEEATGVRQLLTGRQGGSFMSLGSATGGISDGG